MKVVVEAGTHSAWVSRLLKEVGHEVVIANPRKVQWISANSNRRMEWMGSCWPDLGSG